MVAEKMDQIFEDLGKKLKTPIIPGTEGSCRIRFKSGAEVQFAPTSDSRGLTLISRLGEVAPGKYRETLYREALKANGLKPPLNGIFSYSKKSNSLYLFEQMPLDELTGDKLFEALQPFLEKIEIWKGAISRGEVPSYNSQAGTYSGGGGIFGLR